MSQVQWVVLLPAFDERGAEAIARTLVKRGWQVYVRPLNVNELGKQILEEERRD